MYPRFLPQNKVELPNFLANARTLLAKSSSPLPSQNVQMHAKYRVPCTRSSRNQGFPIVFSGKKKLHPLHQLQHVNVRLGILGSQALLVLSLTRQCPALCPWRLEARWDKICEHWFIVCNKKKYIDTDLMKSLCNMCIYVSMNLSVHKSVIVRSFIAVHVHDWYYVYTTCTVSVDPFDDFSSEKNLRKRHFY